MQRIPQLRLEIELLSISKIFNGLSEQTLFLLVHELISHKTEPANSLICKASPHSVFIPKAKNLWMAGLTKFIMGPNSPLKNVMKSTSMNMDEDNFSQKLEESSQNEHPKNPVQRKTSVIMQKVMLKVKGRSNTMKLVDLTNASEDENNGIYIIREGKCFVKNPTDNYTLITLIAGDVFGENEILRIKGYNYFGDIYTENETHFWQIPKKVIERIPEYDLDRMKKNCQENNERIINLLNKCQDRYGGIIDDKDW